MKTPKTAAKKKTSKITILVLVLFILYAAIQSMLSFQDEDKKDTPKNLAEDIVTKNPPRTMSENLRLDKTYLNDLEITFENTLLKADPGMISDGRIKELQATMLGNMTSLICSESEYRTPLEQGISFRYIYMDNKGNQVMQVAIDKRSCI